MTNKSKISIISLIFSITLLFSCSENASSQITTLGIDEFVKTYSTTANAQLLDVRTPAEWEKGKIESSKLIDFKNPDFVQNIKKLDKNRPVFVYCAVGGRSQKAAEVLKSAGFKVYNLANAGYVQVAEKGIK